MKDASIRGRAISLQVDLSVALGIDDSAFLDCGYRHPGNAVRSHEGRHRIIDQQGDRGHAEGAYFGWWNFAAKLTLALSAGLALPMLALAGYTPGTTDPQALTALVLAYCALSCTLKLLAGATLYALVIRPTSIPAPSPSLSRSPS